MTNCPGAERITGKSYGDVAANSKPALPDPLIAARGIPVSL